MTNVVLGIDAAWTERQPSGVALAIEALTGWELLCVESSYEQYYAVGGLGQSCERHLGSFPDAKRLLNSSKSICGQPVSLVAVDMPLSNMQINARRASDQAVSRAYGARKCSTHSPSNVRPGAMSDRLCFEFKNLGYSLQTTELNAPGLIEVYPHPALVELDAAAERLPYKIGKLRKYWPTHTQEERKNLLKTEWKRIIKMLEHEIKGVAKALEVHNDPRTGAEYKAAEDAIDAVVCTWVGICALEGTAKPYGDEISAIWIPTEVHRKV